MCQKHIHLLAEREGLTSPSLRCREPPCKKKADKILQINLRILSAFFSGERGIRTPGTSQYNGFQDRRNRPLCHLSKTSLEVLFFKSDAKVRLFFEFASVWDIFFHLNVFFHLKTTTHTL